MLIIIIVIAIDLNYNKLYKFSYGSDYAIASPNEK